MLATQRKTFNTCSFGGGGGFCIQPRRSGVVSVSCFQCGVLPRSVKVAQKKHIDGLRLLFVQAENNIIAAIVTVSYFCN